MATDAKIVGWITVNGKHIPLREGESKKDAINKAIVKDNEDIKEKQIAQRQKEADERNGKSPKFERPDKPNKNTEAGMAWVMYDKHFSQLTDAEKDKVTNAVIKYKADSKKSNGKGAIGVKTNDVAERNAKALGLDFEKVKKDTIAKYNKALADYKKLGSKGDKMTGDEYNKYKELGRYIKDKKKFVESHSGKPINLKDTKVTNVKKDKNGKVVEVKTETKVKPKPKTTPWTDSKGNTWHIVVPEHEFKPIKKKK